MAVRQELATDTLVQLLFEEPGVGRALLAPDGSVLRANAEWVRSTGCSAGRVAGADFPDLLPGGRDQALATHARARTGHRVDIPRHARRIHGVETWWEGRIDPVPMDDGTGLLITLRETTTALAAADAEGPGSRRAAPTVRAATGPHGTEGALRESEQQLRLLIEHVPAAVAMFDRDMRYLAVSKRFLTDYRIPRVDVIGRSHYELFPEMPERWKEVHRRCLAGAVETAENDPFPRADGTVDWERWEIHPWRTAGGEIGGVILFAELITARKRAEDELRAVNEKLREADRLKDEFLSAASHELRTPLATLSLHTQGLSRMLCGGSLDERRVRRKLTSMEGQLDRLQGLVNTLLDVTRLSAGRLPLDRQPCDLALLAADAVERFEDVAERSGARVLLQASPTVGVWDRLRVDQVLTNLLDNAIKYAPGSAVEVGVVARAGDAVLTVRDSGPGISPESQARIFQQYERAVEAHVFGGLGLGLWITRQIIEAHGGNISVDSAAGAGSTFTVTLPRGCG